MTETGKMTPDLSVKIAGVELKNPVMTCSGTFGSGEEYSEFVDLNGLGAVVTKGIASEPWNGNPTPRVCEVTGGMLNAIGLQGPGIDVFVKRDIPFLRQYDTKIIVNICGHTIEDYIDVTERLADQPVDMLEINISCPNVHEGGKAFGQDPAMVQKVTEAVKRVAKQPVIMKLTPNVTDITEIARAAEAGGADAVSGVHDVPELLRVAFEHRPIHVPEKFQEHADQRRGRGETDQKHQVEGKLRTPAGLYIPFRRFVSAGRQQIHKAERIDCDAARDLQIPVCRLRIVRKQYDMHPSVHTDHSRDQSR